MTHALASSFGLRSIIMVSSTTILFLCLCLTGALATYGPDNHHNGHQNLKLQDSKIRLDSPKIILDRPSINLLGGDGHGHLVHGGLHGSLHEDEPILLAHDKPLYIRKSLHGIPAAYHHGTEGGHLLVNEGYGTGSVISAPIQVINHAPVVHDSPILIRRPVIVSSGGPVLATHGHLSGGHLHYAGGHGHLGNGHLHYAGGHGHYAVPVSGALHEKTLVYGGHGLGHGLAYGGPVVVGPAYGAGLHGGLLLHGGSLNGKVLHGSGGDGHKKY